jgi:hypothetical protein
MTARPCLIAAMVIAMAAPLAAAQPAEPDVWRSFAERLEPNAYVRVRTRDGRAVKGHVVQVGDDGLRVNPRTRVPSPLRDIPYAQVAGIERQKEPRWNPAAKVLLGVGIAEVTVMLVATFALLGYD